ncbi:MAG: hypothetical protein IPK69_04055 [Phycisphaerales bacterium]|nr:MAG: hypothetical protein IPK69_04055 [Phycisphaerales bacterium]
MRCAWSAHDSGGRLVARGMEADGMDMLRQAIETIRKQLGALTASQKLLMGSLAVIVVMTLAFVSLYAGRASWAEPLKGYPAADQQRASIFLTSANIPNTLTPDGRLTVPADREAQARAMLAENGKLPSDKTILFDNLLEKQSWINSRQQNEQIYLIALQNQLAQDISQFKGIKSATVILDIPEAQGIGRAVRLPTASVTVSTTGSALSQPAVDAIAGYVAGSRAGLEIDRVRVIDATTGVQRRASTETDQIPSTYLEHATKVERLTQEKLSSLLSYIPGAIVAVTAQVDVTRVNTQTTATLPKGNGTLVEPKRITEDVTSSTEGVPGAEPGLRSNTELDIANSQGVPGRSNNTSKNETDMAILPGTRTETVVDPKGMTTMVAVSVNVPRGYIEQLLGDQAGNSGASGGGGGSSGAAPDEKAIQDYFIAQIKPQIESTIRPHVRVMTQQANRALSDADLDKLLGQSVSVAMIPIGVPKTLGPVSAGLLGTLTATGGGGLGGSLIEKIGLSTLALIALGMMFIMLKRAGKRVEMPTAEELVGLPPQLDTHSDLVGEADVGETPLTGIEVNETQVQVQKMLEQVGELVEENPSAAAKLLNRWITVEE